MSIRKDDAVLVKGIVHETDRSGKGDVRVRFGTAYVWIEKKFVHSVTSTRLTEGDRVQFDEVVKERREQTEKGAVIGWTDVEVTHNCVGTIKKVMDDICWILLDGQQGNRGVDFSKKPHEYFRTLPMSSLKRLMT